MKNGKPRHFGLLLGALLVLGSASALADSRTDYLINMLENGGTYRVRVQAATTLGKLRAKEAVGPLKNALKDKNELVVISAAAALGQIGDPSAVKDLKAARKKAKKKAVKSQLDASLRILEASGSSTGGEAVAGGKPRFLIHIDAMGNSSGISDEGIADRFREIVAERVGKEVDVVIQPEGLENKDVKKRLKKDKLKGYVLSGSLISLQKSEKEVAVKIALNVLTNPDYNLLMMPSSGGVVPVSSGHTEQAAYDTAIRAVVDKLVKTVFNELRQM